MSRLTKQIKPKGKSASGGRETSPLSLTMRPTSLAGHVIDGVPYPLQGEPPIAQSRGWGDMSWLRHW
jgi:hypothetical protein